METNEKILKLTELFDTKNLPQFRIIISPSGNGLIPLNAAYASQVLDTSLRDLGEDDIPPSRTSQGDECYLVYFEPPHTAENDWSKTQAAIIERNQFGYLHLAFAEFQRTTPKDPNDQALNNFVFSTFGIIQKPSSLIQSILQEEHGKTFGDDGFIQLSPSLSQRNRMFETLNAWSGEVPFTQQAEAELKPQDLNAMADAKHIITRAQQTITGEMASATLREIALNQQQPYPFASTTSPDR